MQATTYNFLNAFFKKKIHAQYQSIVFPDVILFHTQTRNNIIIFLFTLNDFIHFCFDSKSLSDNVHYHTQKETQGGMTLKTKIKFNHNIYEIVLTQMIHAKLSKTRK